MRRPKTHFKRLRKLQSDELEGPHSDKYPAIIYKKFLQWNKLKSWGVDLSDINFRIQTRRDAESTGRADDEHITVTAGSNRADGFATLLHELAHSASMRRGIDDGHGEEWKNLFLKVAQKILKCKITVEDNSHVGVHDAVKKAFSIKFPLAKQ